MKREERWQLIMDLLVDRHAVDLDDLAQHFVVSKMTIHRDLDDLQQAGMLRKVRALMRAPNSRVILGFVRDKMVRRGPAWPNWS